MCALTSQDGQAASRPPSLPPHTGCVLAVVCRQQQQVVLGSEEHIRPLKAKGEWREKRRQLVGRPGRHAGTNTVIIRYMVTGASLIITPYPASNF